jgi:hypothetical protein
MNQKLTPMRFAKFVKSAKKISKFFEFRFWNKRYSGDTVFMTHFPSFFNLNTILSFLSPFPTVLWTMGFLFFLFSFQRFFRFLEFPGILMGIMGCLIGWLSIEKSTLSISATLDGFAGPFLLPLPKESSEVALVFMAAGWSSAFFLYLLKQRTLAGREIPKWISLSFLLAIALGLGYLGHGTAEAIHIASRPDDPSIIPSLPTETLKLNDSESAEKTPVVLDPNSSPAQTR